jgi:hypothetical protein
LKNRVQAILDRNLVPRCPAADLFGVKGRRWLAEQELPFDERRSVEALLRQLDFHAEALRLIDAELARVALAREEGKRLMTIPGVDATVALSIVAAVGDFGRFRSPAKLVSYLGLNPRVRQSGSHPAAHGRITKQGRAHARAGCSSKPPSPRPAFQVRCAPSTNASAPTALPPPRRQLADEAAGDESGCGCRHWGAALRPSSGKPARRGSHPHAPLFGPRSPAPSQILRRRPPTSA